MAMMVDWEYFFPDVYFKHDRFETWSKEDLNKVIDEDGNWDPQKDFEFHMQKLKVDSKYFDEKNKNLFPENFTRPIYSITGFEKARNELLNRVGMTPQMGYYGSQDEFRNAVMYEYRFEVLGEGEDAHNNRRRGFDYFLNNTILFHNYNPLHNPAVDLTLSEDESQVMNLLIPLVEINSNNLID